MNSDTLDDFHDVPDQTLAEWIQRHSQRMHERFNPNFGPGYDTTSGVQFRIRDAIAYQTVQRAAYAPLAISGGALLMPAITSEVDSSGGAEVYHVTPGSSGGLLGFFGWVFGWED